MKRPALLLLSLLVLACKRDPATPEPAKPEVVATSEAKPAVTPATDDPWTAKAEPAPDALKRVLLWSITKDGKTSYAMGTMHVGIDPARLPKVVWDKLLGATSFAMETNAADAQILNLGARTSGSLRADLGPVYWEKLSKLVEPKMLAGIDQKKPVIAAVFLSMRGLPMTGLGMDSALLAKAQTASKPIVYLEPASLQAQLLERHMDIKALKLMIDTADQSAEMTKQMVAAYVAGDDKKLLALNDGQKGEALSHGYTEAEYEKQSAEMLYDRNASWIPAIEEMHSKGGGFVAVGALHLVGKKSVLDLLEAKGYKIQRVEP
jgi:uncharacterized protein YbaP (TraB family)